MGGPAVLSFLSKKDVLIIAVTENETYMNVTKDNLFKNDSISHNSNNNNVNNNDNSSVSNIIVVRSYAEAAGYLLAHKNGILFDSITNYVPFIPITYL